MAAAVIVVAVVVGMFVVGGPIQGRQDKLDRQRYLELAQIARALLCDVRPNDIAQALPHELSVEAMSDHCSRIGVTAALLTDGDTGVPYTYNRIDDHSFSVCATFFDAERTERLFTPYQRAAGFDASTGCMSGRIE